MIVAIILVIGAVIGLFLWLTLSMLKQSKKDWDTVRYFEARVNTVFTLDEIKSFHAEFVEKASKIHNEYCQPRLAKIDGYLRGLYKSLTTTTPTSNAK